MGQGVAAPEPSTCSYGTSRLVFRGPRRPMQGAYVAALGGARTFGKGVERPWPAELETRLGLPVVNLGAVGAGPDAFLDDRSVLAACAGAAVTVLQVPGAQALSNPWFRVHPRRNDRFLCASDRLKALYPEVDFCDYSFTRQLLCDLHACDATRFSALAGGLQRVWTTRLQQLLAAIDGPVLLLWLADHAPDDRIAPRPGSGIGLVTRGMLAALRPAAAGLVEVVAPTLRPGGTPADLPGPEAHEAAAAALRPALARLGPAAPAAMLAAG